jgi:DNA polymerase-3 subunit delta
MTTPVPAVLVVGDDPYLVSEAVSKALEGIDHLSVEDVPPQEDRTRVLHALESTSLFGGRRAVVLRGVDEAPAEVQRSFIAYLKDPNPDCLLVLTTSKPLSGLAEAVRKVGHVVEAAKGRRNDLFTWLREKARELDLRTSGDSMGVLMEAVGEERMALAQALEELSLALGPGGRVTPDAVSRQFKGRGQVNMFGFLDAAATGQTGIALQGLRRLLEQGESAQAILNALARHFRSMMEVGEGPAARAAKELGMHPFRAEKLVKQATGYSPPALARAYRAIAAADHRTKAGEEAEDLALERAVVAVTALRTGADSVKKGARRGF